MVVAGRRLSTVSLYEQNTDLIHRDCNAKNTLTLVFTLRLMMGTKNEAKKKNGEKLWFSSENQNMEKISQKFYGNSHAIFLPPRHSIKSLVCAKPGLLLPTSTPSARYVAFFFVFFFFRRFRFCHHAKPSHDIVS
jgi:hypothetical protein